MPQQPPGRRPRLAWALLGLTVVLLASGLVIGFTGGEAWNQKFATIPVDARVRCGRRAGRRADREPPRMAVPGCWGGGAVTWRRRPTRPGPRPPGYLERRGSGWIFTVVLGIVATLFFLVPLLFPDGRPPSRRWWPVVWVAIIDGLVQMVTVAVSDANFYQQLPQTAGSGDGSSLRSGTAYNQAEAVGLLVLLAGVASMIVRFRRSGTEERLQLKWFMYASAIAAVVILVASPAE